MRYRIVSTNAGANTVPIDFTNETLKMSYMSNNMLCIFIHINNANIHIDNVNVYRSLFRGLRPLDALYAVIGRSAVVGFAELRNWAANSCSATAGDLPWS